MNSAKMYVMWLWLGIPGGTGLILLLGQMSRASAGFVLLWWLVCFFALHFRCPFCKALLAGTDEPFSAEMLKTFWVRLWARRCWKCGREIWSTD